MVGAVAHNAPGSSTIICPHGHGRTDFARCCENYRQRKPHCATCVGPIYLAACGRGDEFNARLADKLKKILWPQGLKTRIGHVSRFKALAMSVSTTLRKAPDAERINLVEVLRRYRSVPGAVAIRDIDHLRSVIRMAGLPIQFLPNRTYALPVNDHVRAFVRGYVREAA